MKTITYFYRGGVERAATKNGKPTYQWHNGFSANSEDGKPLYPWSTIRECQAEAKKEGATAEFKTREGKPWMNEYEESTNRAD